MNLWTFADKHPVFLIGLTMAFFWGLSIVIHAFRRPEPGLCERCFDELYDEDDE